MRSQWKILGALSVRKVATLRIHLNTLQFRKPHDTPSDGIQLIAITPRDIYMLTADFTSFATSAFSMIASLTTFSIRVGFEPRPDGWWKEMQWSRTGEMTVKSFESRPPHQYSSMLVY